MLQRVKYEPHNAQKKMVQRGRRKRYICKKYSRTKKKQVMSACREKERQEKTERVNYEERESRKIILSVPQPFYPRAAAENDTAHENAQR